MVWTPRATVAAIIEREQKFLMVEEISHGEKVFNQPAGHLDDGENLIEAVIRETREETAWRFTPDFITGFYQWKHPQKNITYMRTAFAGKVNDFCKTQSLDDGIIRAIWMSRDELIAQHDRLRSPMVLQCIDDYLAGKSYPLELITHL